jgi:hypothetical protein
MITSFEVGSVFNSVAPHNNSGSFAMFAAPHPCEQLGRRSPARLILEIDIRELLPRAILHDKGRSDILDEPGRWQAAIG